MSSKWSASYIKTFGFTKGTSQKSVCDILKTPQVYINKFFKHQHINIILKNFIMLRVAYF